MDLPLRFLTEVGTRTFLRIYWGDCCGSSGRGYHNAEMHLGDSDKLGDWEMGGKPSDYANDRWPTTCGACGAGVPPTPDPVPCDCGVPGCTKLPDDAPRRSIHHRRMYRAPAGEVIDRPVPGDVYIGTGYHYDLPQCPTWDNCDGRHIVVVTPDGHDWDTSGRARNCGLPDDRTHRCWVLHGTAEQPNTLHVDKAGHTCNAGAGSIDTGKWHGFLHGGKLTPC